MTNFEMYLDNYMLYCESKNLSKKTMASYEQTLKLFMIYLETEHHITEIEKVKPVHIRSYIKYLRERGKYTVVADERSKTINYPEKRTDYSEKISDTTIANYRKTEGSMRSFWGILNRRFWGKNNRP